MNHSFQNIEHNAGQGNPTLFLPGWGFDGKILSLLRPSPAWMYADSVLDPETMEKDIADLLDAHNIATVRLVGWSMGAMMGLNFASRYPDRVSSLTLISLRSNWPVGEIRDLQSAFSEDAGAFLKDFYRKCFLGNRSAYRIFSNTIEPSYLSGLADKTDLLLKGLRYLAAYKMPVNFPRIPIKLMHGKQDIIAPVSEMPSIAGSDLEIIDNAGHTVFLHDNCSLQNEIRKQVIRSNFSRAANSYDNYAKIQAEVARRLVEKIPAANQHAEINTILEIGCGTGNFTKMLAARFPSAKITALDFSTKMLDSASRKLGQQNIEFICAEAEEYLEKAPGKSFNLVCSNGSLQWFSDADRALYNIRRILSTNGSMYCSLFGPESIHELGQALQAIGAASSSIAARAFTPPAELVGSLGNYFRENSFEEEFIEKKYRSTHDLLLHIQKTGTAGWQNKKQQQLTPLRVKQLDQWFEKTYGVCKVTYQIFFLQGSK